MKNGLILILVFVFFQNTHSQKKIIIAQISDKIEIDGILNDKAWEEITAIEDFVGFQPVSGIKPSVKTKIKVGYDRTAIYFGAMLYDNPDSIRKRLTLRDNVDADNFICHLSPFNDGTSWYEFWVTCSGVQMDSFIEPTSGWSYKWDAVWESRVTIVDSGWIAEIKVPFSILRIPKNKEQVWGFNMFRQVKWKNQVISWNIMDPDGPKGTYFYSTQLGELQGIRDIYSGTKIWFWPYASFYAENNHRGGKSKPIYQTGMDLKYGINESFNLDMVLIPDFTQIRTDDRVLNLTPFEIQFDEQRQFFHEGSDLFNKADIFYSRRIGGTPSGNIFINGNLNKNEVIVNLTENSRILNATKITGRTNKGLGLGLLNSITSNEYAQIKDTLTGSIHVFKTQPFTNYNVLVADQTFGKSSYLTIINTNIFRKLLLHERDIPGKNYIANVTALDSKIYIGDYVFMFYGAHSYKPIRNEFTSGYYYNVQFGRDKGEFRFLINRILYSENYDPNDMGYLKINNLVSNVASVSYNINKPFNIFQTFLNTVSLNVTSKFKPKKFSDLIVSHSFTTKLKNQWVIKINQQYRPVNSYDFYEPRSEGNFFLKPKSYNPVISITTDQNKFIALGYGVDAQYMKNPVKGKSVSFPLDIWVKLTDKLTFNYNVTNVKKTDDRGYVKTNYETEEIYFSRRNVNTIENILYVSYIFSPNAALDIRARHYYSAVVFKQFYLLADDGNLKPETHFRDSNYYYDALTSDITYKWHYKPGSNLSVLLRHQVYNNFNSERTYFNALSETLKSKGTTSISIKFLYYLDYNNLVKNQKRI